MAKKSARLIVLGVALVAAGGAYFVSRSRVVSHVTEVPVNVPAPIAIDHVLVAKRDLPMGLQITALDMEWREWPKEAISPEMIRQSDMARAPDDIAGSIVRGAFLAGEPIRRDKMVKGGRSGFMSALLESGYRAVAISIDAQGANSAGGFILPNDRVDIIQVSRDSDASRTEGRDVLRIQTILSNVRVLAIGQNVQEKNGQPVVVGTTATLELTQQQAETVILAQRNAVSGNLSLSLRAMVDAKGEASNTIVADRSATSTMVVRFGVATQAESR